jgi:hypothetical protein
MKKDLLFDEGVDCNKSNINTPPILKGILKFRMKTCALRSCK